MSIAGITGTNISDTYVTGTTSKEKNVAANTTETEKNNTSGTTENSSAAGTDKTTTENTAAVYDKSSLSADDRKAIVAQLKADQEKRQAQLTSLVQDMISKQTNTFGAANNIWQFLAKGDFTVDAATKKKAQEDISEDGYWGVKQTSDRIVSFATALAGNDSESLKKMRDAFLKGYEQAEKTWGGKLPDISQRTYDAVLEKLDKLIKPTAEDTTASADGTVVTKPEE